MNKWTDDVLLIKYPDLGGSADERLHILSMIGILLNKERGLYTPTLLGLLADEWETLCAWLEQGHGEQFWYLEPLGLRIAKECEKHILIGTDLLLSDLRSTHSKQQTFRQLSLDDVWIVARNYVMTEVTLEVD